MNIDERAEDYIEDTENIETKNLQNDSAAVPKKNIFIDILKSKTGQGTIEDYKEHPLNFNNNSGLGQILRGLTGILGQLDLAIIDIFLGGFKILVERKQNV